MLKSLKSDRGVRFAPDLFSEADIRAMTVAVAPPPMRALAMAEPVSRLAGVNAVPSRADIDRGLKAALAFLKRDPKVAAVLTRRAEADILAAARKRLVAGLQKRTVNEGVVQENLEQRQRIALIEKGAVLSLAVGGRPILSADRRTPLGESFGWYLQLCMVIVDVVFVIAAIVGVAVYRGAKWAEKIAAIFKGVKDYITGLGRKLIATVGSWISTLVKAQALGTSKFLSAVKSACVKLGPVVYELLKGLYDCGHKLWQVIRSLFAGSALQIISATLSFMGAVLALIASFGASLVIQMINLVATVAILAGDIITLYLMKEKTVALAGRT